MSAARRRGDTVPRPSRAALLAGLPRPGMRSPGRVGALSPAILVLACLLWLPSPLPAQSDTTAAALESGDLVRIREAGGGSGPDEYRFRGWKSDSLVLRASRYAAPERLARRRVETLEVWRDTGGTYFWEGVLIGGGAGLAADLIWSGVGCANASPSVYSPGPCFAVAPVVLLPFTVLPGAALGGLVGALGREHEWVSVEVGPAAGAASPAASALAPAVVPGAPGVRGTRDPGLSVRIELRPPGLP